MNKKVNSFIFVICGTLLSIVLFLALAAIFLVTFGFFFLKLPAEPMVTAFSISLMFSIIAALFLNMLIYQKIGGDYAQVQSIAQLLISVGIVFLGLYEAGVVLFAITLVELLARIAMKFYYHKTM